MDKGLIEKTGKTLDEWVKIVKATKLEKHGDIINYLKTEHDFTHGFANLVAHTARESSAASFAPDDLVSSQYTKGKEALKPIYDKLITVITTFGNDIEIAPKKANVSLRAKRQFALIQPSTKTRVDVGLKYNNKPTGERLKDSGIFGAMCTHRVELTTVDDIDDQLISWLREAYQEAAG